MANMIVCMKQVLDPEAPVSTFKIDPETKKVFQPGVPPVLNPYDEYALEAALRIKDSQQSEVTILSLGKTVARAIARKALAAGADKLVLLEDEQFENLDSSTSAYILAAAIKKLGAFDLIFTGRQAADTNAGIVGSGIAEILGIPSITTIRKAELINNSVKAERVIGDGYEVIEAPLPALITVSHELGNLRSVNMKGLLAAQKVPVTTWKAGDLDVQLQGISRNKMINLFSPQRESNCEIIKGASDEEISSNLAIKLKEARLI